MKRIYLDYAASTPVRKEVVKAMLPYFSERYGNAGSLHSFGQEAIAAVDSAREAAAQAIGAEFREIVFTGSATEANNLTLRGVLRGYRESGIGYREQDGSGTLPPKPYPLHPKIIVSAIEHESVLDTAHALEREGTEVVVLPVDGKGIVDVNKLEEALDERTVLVSVMYVNNEIGIVEPLAKISRIIGDFKKSLNPNPQTLYPLLHTDAAQAPMYLDCDVRKLGVDLMTLSGQKVRGPKGIGALYVCGNSLIPKPYALTPMITGGGQEFGLRSGTENTPSIVGFGKAIELAAASRAKNAKYVEGIKNYFWKKLKAVYKKAEINGGSDAPHILNVYFPGEFTGDFLVRLDRAGIAASAGSACSARAFTPSHVLHALGLPGERVRGSVRFSFGPMTAKAEIDEAVKRIKGLV